MPIPKPNVNESQENYMKRCISFLVNEGTEQEQAVAICNTQWDDRNEDENDDKSFIDLLTIKSNKEFTVTNYEIKNEIIDIETQNKTVDIVLNTYLFMDHEDDVLLPGCSAKSIKENGPENNSKNPKIKFCKDHVMTVDSPGKFLILKEEKINNEEKLWARAEFVNDDIGMGLYERYLKEMIDQHSIGFLYGKILLASKDKQQGFDYNTQDNYHKYIEKLLNPEKADKTGYFFLVPEIKLIEGSAVPWGCNEKTEVLSVKSLEGKKTNLLYRMSILQKSLFNSKSEEFRYYANLEIAHIKNEIENILNIIYEPSIKSTLFKKIEPEKIDTPKGIDYNYIINKI